MTLTCKICSLPMIKLPSEELTRVDIDVYRCEKGHQKYFSNIEYEKSLGTIEEMV